MTAGLDYEIKSIPRNPRHLSPEIITTSYIQHYLPSTYRHFLPSQTAYATTIVPIFNYEYNSYISLQISVAFIVTQAVTTAIHKQIHPKNAKFLQKNQKKTKVSLIVGTFWLSQTTGATNPFLPQNSQCNFLLSSLVFLAPQIVAMET